MMTPRSSTVLLARSVLVGALALAPPAQAQSRGELLYSTHCIACHTTQMHWRDKKQATDWNSLKAQVRAWQATARLEWSEDDVAEVARHLNERFYRFAQPSAALGSLNPARADQCAISTGTLIASSMPRVPPPSTRSAQRPKWIKPDRRPTTLCFRAVSRLTGWPAICPLTRMNAHFPGFALPIFLVRFTSGKPGKGA
jgi:hypothetical protein